MLSLFPGLFPWSLLGLTAIRLVAGICMLSRGTALWRGAPAAPRRLYAGLIVAVGMLLVLGIFTQAAAIALIVDSTIRFGRRLRSATPEARGLYAALIAIGICLLLSGAGSYAFDLPL